MKKNNAPKDTIMNLAFVFDKNYAPYMLPLLESIKENTKGVYFNLYIITTDVGDTEKELLSNAIFPSQGKIIYRYLEDNDIKLIKSIFGAANTDYPLITCAKFLISWFIPKNINRILYLDVDMITLADLSELYFMDFQDKCLIACHEFVINYEPFKGSKKYYTFFNKAKYINSGMLLLNPPKIRQKFSIDTIKYAAKKLKGHLKWIDQDMYNYLFTEDIILLDALKYNYPVSVPCTEEFGQKATLAFINQNTVILHFLQKPWSDFHFISNYFYEIWWKYALKTPLALKWIIKSIGVKDKIIRSLVLDSLIKGIKSKNISLTDILRNFFEHYDFHHIGIYGAGNYGKLIISNLPEEYDYIIFDRKLPQINGFKVISSDDIYNYSNLDVIIFTPFGLDNLRTDLVNKFSIPVISFECILYRFDRMTE